jgi:hypothetical protein
MARVKFNVNGEGIDAEGKVIANPGAADEANLQLTPNTAPTAPASGDVWNESGVIKVYNGTATKTVAYTDSNITGSAASLTTARTITLGGDLTGSASFDGSANVTLTATVAADSVALGTDTTGNYVATVAGTTDQVTVTGAGTEGRAVTLSLPQSIATTSSPTFAGVTLSGDLAVNGSDITTTGTGTATVFNSNAAAVNIGQGASAVAIGSATSTVTVGNNLAITGNLTINGTTTTVNSTTVTIDDPVFTLGGDTAPASDDNKDRGIEFRYHNGTSAQLGFFGYDDSTQKFTFLTGATNASEVFSGTKGILDVGSVETTTLFVGGKEIDTVGATSSQVLQYNGTKFVPVTLANASAFTTIAVSGQSNVEADQASDTLTLVGGTGVSITTNATTDTITITNSGVTSLTGTTNQVSVSASTGGVTLSLPSTINVNTTGSAATLTTARTITLGGDLTGSVSFNGSADVTLTATVAANSVALGTDTTGNYIATVAGTANQVTVTGSGSETAAVTLSLPQDIHTGASPTFSALTAATVTGDAINQRKSGTTVATQTVDSITTTATTAATIHAVSTTAYRSVKYVVQAVQGSNYMTTEILAVHNGSSVTFTEYATLTVGTAPASFDMDIATGEMRLRVTPASATSTVFKVHAVGITA